jgi:hypothetical protein
MGLRKGEVCGVGLVREYELEAEVAWVECICAVEGGVGWDVS